MVDRRSTTWSPDPLFREAEAHLQFLLTDHGFRQVVQRGKSYATVEFQGERLTLYLTHADREFDFYAEIKYHRFPRKNPKFVWSVFEALGISRGPVAMGVMVGDDTLRTMIATLAELIKNHWEIIDRDPTEDLFREVKKIEDRYARSVRKR
jgi:hypothetical protein